jgi:hypothetical protein
VPPPNPLIYNVQGVRKYNQQPFDTFTTTFSQNEPQISFICEYYADEEKSLGVLVVWEAHYDATHYELYKKNIFEDTDFKRILFLETPSLAEETSKYVSYLKNHLGIALDPDNNFIIFDADIKPDRIYEYKILASRVPKNIKEVDYGSTILSKALGTYREVSSVNNYTLFDFAAVTLGSSQVAWVIALLNSNIHFFGLSTSNSNLYSMIAPKTQVLFVSDLLTIMSILNNSYTMFGIKNSLMFMISLLGNLDTDFQNAFSTSINEGLKTFSYDNFITSIKAKVPILNTIYTISQTANNADALTTLSQLSINLPTNSGTESITSMEGLSNIFNFVNNLYLDLIYSQQKNNPTTILNLLTSLQQSNNAAILAAAQKETVVTAAPIVIAPVVQKNPVSIIQLLNTNLGGLSFKPLVSPLQINSFGLNINSLKNIK